MDGQGYKALSEHHNQTPCPSKAISIIAGWANFLTHMYIIMAVSFDIVHMGLQGYPPRAHSTKSSHVRSYLLHLMEAEVECHRQSISFYIL